MDLYPGIQNVVKDFQQRNVFFPTANHFYGFKIIRHLRQTNTAATAHLLRCAAALPISLQSFLAPGPTVCAWRAGPETLPATTGWVALRSPCRLARNQWQSFPAPRPARPIP